MDLASAPRLPRENWCAIFRTASAVISGLSAAGERISLSPRSEARSGVISFRTDSSSAPSSVTKNPSSASVAVR